MHQKNLSIVFTLLGLLFVAGNGQADERKSVLKNPQVINEYREVVAAMKALQVTDPRSWKYQSGVHLHFDVGSLPPEHPFRDLFKKHSLTPPPHASANSTWDQCHQSDPDRVFLLWHRVYVYYFEQIAKKVSGKPNFTLPYWDYGTDVESRRIPAEFRSHKYIDPKTNVELDNPLYEQRRASINNGAALELEAVLPEGLSESNFDTFSQALEVKPHNEIHTALGDENALAMGIPNFAAQDPIFWLHHANIDRLYSCWQTRFASPVQSDDGKKYQFINGDGMVVSHTVTEMQSLVKNMPITYEDLADCKKLLPPSPIPAAPLAPFSLLKDSAAKGASIVLGTYDTETVLKAEPLTVQLKMETSAKAKLKSAFTFETIQPSKAAAIEIKGFSLQNPPGVSFGVYLKPVGSTSKTMLPVGTMSFFQHLAVDEGHHHTKDKNYYFEVKYLPLEMQESGVEVVFIPKTGVEGDNTINAEVIKRAEPKFKEIKLILK